MGALTTGATAHNASIGGPEAARPSRRSWPTRTRFRSAATCRSGCRRPPHPADGVGLLDLVIPSAHAQVAAQPHRASQPPGHHSCVSGNSSPCTRRRAMTRRCGLAADGAGKARAAEPHYATGRRRRHLLVADGPAAGVLRCRAGRRPRQGLGRDALPGARGAALTPSRLRSSRPGRARPRPRRRPRNA